MQINILEYLENTVKKHPNKTAFHANADSLTFSALYSSARSVGSFVLSNGFFNEPIVVFMPKQPKTIAAFLGVIYSGNYYVPLDSEMPLHRIELIFKSLNPRAVICDEASAEVINKLECSGKVFLYNEICNFPVDEAALSRIRSSAIDTDPIYIVFTSGSTGLPKGVVACHRSVIDYIENLCSVLQINEDTVFGNQAPLYVDACLKELLPTLKFGAETFFIPKEHFMFPIKLIEYLNEHRVNTICWVASALSIISGYGTFEKNIPRYLRTIAFGSEVFPVKQLNAWRKALPEARFINLYGPTEATGMSCYHVIDREYGEDEVIPIGKPFKNTDIILLDEGKRIVKPGIPGEICIRGTALTLGYYNNPEKTAEAFRQNPLNTAYNELIYHTGDLGKYNSDGELVFVSRKDYQIKHMGHRIELGEIEYVIAKKDGVTNACCIFDEIKKKIVLFYASSLPTAEIAVFLREKLPRYMVPNAIFQMEVLPLTANGKIDRVYLKQHYNKQNE